MLFSAYPIFAQQGYENPREATGRIVCANCHLANKPVDIEVPQISHGFIGAALFFLACLGLGQEGFLTPSFFFSSELFHKDLPG